MKKMIGASLVFSLSFLWAKGLKSKDADKKNLEEGPSIEPDLEDSDQESTAPEKETLSNEGASLDENAKGVEVLDLRDLDFNGDEVTEATEELGAQDSSMSSTKVQFDDIVVDKAVDYHFASFNRRDPFQPFDFTLPYAELMAEKSQLSESPVISPLQKGPASSMLVGAIWQKANKEWFALISNSLGESEIVKIGDLIGAGKVLSISANEVVAREYAKRRDGSQTFRDVMIYLVAPPKQLIIKSGPGEEPKVEERVDPLSKFNFDQTPPKD